ncbi:ABC-F family ATP-binding cassette domain-containing protein [Gracilibacillus sp. YIM 98692]|uniref:ABC-F family ATP-binding cassette domain-containing protein n=1 Tax=Gracilibacillus sp. YIM 98692 TaxID=2663532 RepID=UPI0013D8CF03|nr:ABC-F family ATP-binding cassette domain-containing protein [Gracilibacillus sp. YIM 98692]
MRGLKVEELSKTHGEKVLFNQISFSLTTEDRIGLIGVNGTGKSTLLKVISGIEPMESGRIDHPNDFQIEYLDQDPELTTGYTVLDQIYYGDADIMVTLRKYEKVVRELETVPNDGKVQQRLLDMQAEMDRLEAWDAMTKAKMILSKLGVPSMDQQVETLSGGQKKRVAIAKALIQPADLLILDEPTNHLDNETIEWLEEYLPQYTGAVMLVTHDRYFLNRMTNRIFELDKGKLYSYQGNYQTFLEQKALREEQELQAEQKHKNILKKEIAWLKSGVKARTTKQKARIDRVEQMKEKTFDTKKNEISFQVGSVRLGKKVMEADRLSKSFDGQPLFEDFSLLIKPGDRIGIVGPNGSGKTTLLNILAGKEQADQGNIEVGETVKIGYYTQDHPALDDTVRVIDLVREVAEVVHTIDGDVITAEQMLERFLFPRSQQWTYVRMLSGGEKRRLYLLTVLMQEPNVLFLDEPTNDLDTETLAVLEDYLDQFPGVVITVSHDRYFLDKTVDQLIAFTGEKKLNHFYGNYSDFRKQLMDMNKMPDKPKADNKKPKRRKKLSYHEQKEWETIEDDITELEAELEETKKEIAEAGSDLGKVEPLYKKQNELEQILEEKMERWETLSLKVEELQ